MMRFVLQPVRGEHEQALADIDRMEHGLDLDRDLFASTLMDASVDGILWNCGQEKDPEGVYWPRLSAGYKAWKDQFHPGHPTGVLFGIMITVEQLSGVRVITADQASMTYGISPQAIVEAVKFTEGGAVTGTNQPPRPFYGFTAEAIADIETIADRRFQTFTIV